MRLSGSDVNSIQWETSVSSNRRALLLPLSILPFLSHFKKVRKPETKPGTKPRLISKSRESIRGQILTFGSECLISKAPCLESLTRITRESSIGFIGNWTERRGVWCKIWSSKVGLRAFDRGTGFVRLKREFQLGVNGRYEISGGLKRNALSTAIYESLGSDWPIYRLSFCPFLKKKRNPFQTRHILLALRYHTRAVSKGSTRFPRLPPPSKARLRTHANRFAKWSSSRINPGIFDRYRGILFPLRSFQNCANRTITFYL